MRIKELREKLGLTQEGLADKINGRTAWIEQQEREPLCMWTEQQLQLVATALDCTVGELFDAPEASQKLQPVEKPEWAVVYEKLEKKLDSIPFNASGIKVGLFAQIGPSLSIRQDYLGNIAVQEYISHELLFSAHPKVGAVCFEKGEWLDILDEASS